MSEKQKIIDELQAHFIATCGDSGPTGVYADEAYHFLRHKIKDVELTEANEEIRRLTPKGSGKTKRSVDDAVDEVGSHVYGGSVLCSKHFFMTGPMNPCPHCRAEKAERRNIDLQLKTQDAIAIMQGKLDSEREENKRLREALKDMLSGWRYIRDTHGDMYGVGWERAQEKAEQALKEVEK